MPTDEEWRDIQHSVERHETAVTEDAKDIRKIQEQLALIVEALSKLEFLIYKSGHPTQEEAIARLKEIVGKLSGDFRA